MDYTHKFEYQKVLNGCLSERKNSNKNDNVIYSQNSRERYIVYFCFYGIRIMLTLILFQILYYEKIRKTEDIFSIYHSLFLIRSFVVITTVR